MSLLKTPPIDVWLLSEIGMLIESARFAPVIASPYGFPTAAITLPVTRRLGSSEQCIEPLHDGTGLHGLIAERSEIPQVGREATNDKRVIVPSRRAQHMRQNHRFFERLNPTMCIVPSVTHAETHQEPAWDVGSQWLNSPATRTLSDVGGRSLDSLRHHSRIARLADSNAGVDQVLGRCFPNDRPSQTDGQSLPVHSARF